MAKKLALPVTVKLIGGPKDGEILQSPASKVPDSLEFRSSFLLGQIHVYGLKEKYASAGYMIYVFEHEGSRALE